MTLTQRLDNCAWENKTKNEEWLLMLEIFFLIHFFYWQLKQVSFHPWLGPLMGSSNQQQLNKK